MQRVYLSVQSPFLSATSHHACLRFDCKRISNACKGHSLICGNLLEGDKGGVCDAAKVDWLMQQNEEQLMQQKSSV